MSDLTRDLLKLGTMGHCHADDPWLEEALEKIEAIGQTQEADDALAHALVCKLLATASR